MSGRMRMLHSLLSKMDRPCLRFHSSWYDITHRPPLWSGGQSSWLQILRSGLDSRCYQIFWVVGLEWGSLSLVCTVEELLERKSRGSGIENRDYGRRGSAALTTLHPSTSATSGGRSVGIVRSRIQATEFMTTHIEVTSTQAKHRRNLHLFHEENISLKMTKNTNSLRM
jgi:hypothetical protein